jgi:hypothetical protein
MPEPASDLRGFRVALVADEFMNAPAVDALAVLQAEDWGVIQLPSAGYPDDVAGPLLEQVAEQADEFARHGYRLAVVGERAGLADALAPFGLAGLPAVVPGSPAELEAFLRGLADGG